jgi:hypothetical protein
LYEGPFRNGVHTGGWVIPSKHEDKAAEHAYTAIPFALVENAR